MTSTAATRPAAVFGDLNAFYQASIEIGKDNSVPVELDYAALKEAVSAHFKMGDPRDMFTIWSSSDPANLGQQRLFQFLERQRISIRRFSPRDSYIFEPDKLGLDHKSHLLQRFSGSIAFAAGVTCKSHRIIIMSDSFQLAEPLVRASALAGAHGHPGLVFWKTHLDPRWHQVIDRYKIDVLDLDTMQHKLFRSKGEQVGKPQPVRLGFDDDFLMGKS